MSDEVLLAIGAQPGRIARVRLVKTLEGPDVIDLLS
jgi:hypothetical protein